jgi:hypothetical protein
MDQIQKPLEKAEGLDMKLFEDFKALSPRRKIIALSLVVAITVAINIDQHFFHSQILYSVLILEWVAVALFIIFLMGVVGFVMTDVLFDVAAGLSLTIFLGQAYCASFFRSVSSDSALKILLVFGLAFVLYDFLRKLRDKWRKVDDGLPEFTRTERVVFQILLAVIVLWFFYLICQVMTPIVTDILICKKA